MATTTIPEAIQMATLSDRQIIHQAVADTDRVVVFDGVCRLCDGWVRFLLRHDRAHCFRLCPAQSTVGNAMLRVFEQPTDRYDSVMLVQGSQVWLKSDAVLAILAALPVPWRLVAVLKLIPRPVRDWVYDRIARNRYRWFGRYDHCVLPAQEDRHRFVDTAP